MDVFGEVFVVEGELDSDGGWVEPVRAREHELDLHSSRAVVSAARGVERHAASVVDEVRGVGELEAESINEGVFGCLDMCLHCSL